MIVGSNLHFYKNENKYINGEIMIKKLKQRLSKPKKELTYDQIKNKYPNLDITMNITENQLQRGLEMNIRSITCLYYKSIVNQKKINKLFKSHNDIVEEINYNNITNCKCDYCIGNKKSLLKPNEFF